MAASLTLQPPSKAYSGDRIFAEITTDQIDSDRAKVQILVGGSPTIGQVFTLSWLSNTLTWTVAAAENTAGTAIPTQGALSLSAYIDLLVNLFAKSEILTAAYKVSRVGDAIIFEYRELTMLTQTHTENLDNFSVFLVNITTPPAPANLRAVVQVHADTGNVGTDTLLLKQHATYDYATSKADFDLSASFDHLQPHLPDAAGINPATPPSAWSYGLANLAFQRYYLRWADKYGTPAKAEALNRMEGYKTAIFGSHAGDSKSPTTVPSLCHNYFRADGRSMTKPVSEEQPDWVYWFCPLAGNYYPTVLVRWSDGSQQTYNPFGTGGVALEFSKLYWFAAGFRQLKLETLAPPSAGAYIVGYDFRIGPQDDAFNYPVVVNFSVACDCHPWTHYLLFSNGVGGCETVWLRGKTDFNYESVGETFRRFDWKNHTPADGNFQKHAVEARQAWEFDTGWFDDIAYPQHLLQLPLSETWLVDIVNRRFLRVIVEPGKMRWKVDDEQLFSLSFSARAAWVDANYNL